MNAALSANAAPWGAIDQTAQIAVGGLSYMRGSTITLTNTSNRFTGGLDVTTKDGNASIVDSGDLTLDSVRTTGSFLGVAGTGKNVIQNGHITTGTGAVLVADSANGGVFTSTFGNITAASGRYLIYSHDPASTTLGSLAPAFTHTGATYSSYAPGSVTETGSGIIYVTTAAPAPASGSGGSSTTALANTIANAITAPQTNLPPSIGLPGSFLPSGGVAPGTGQPSTFVNVTNPLPFVSAAFGPGERFAVVSSPSASEPTQAVTLAQARSMMQSPGQNVGNGGASDAVRDVRVPVSRNSLADIVNGGVRLPNGVEQELFVVAAD
jgi:hypothetical protein